MRIDWWTLALQAANFLVLVWLLQHFLYRPVQAIIMERQQQADGVLAAADATRAVAERLRSELEEQRAALERDRHQAVEEALARARVEAAALLERARADHCRGMQSFSHGQIVAGRAAIRYRENERKGEGFPRRGKGR